MHVEVYSLVVKAYLHLYPVCRPINLLRYPCFAMCHLYNMYQDKSWLELKHVQSCNCSLVGRYWVHGNEGVGGDVQSAGGLVTFDAIILNLISCFWCACVVFHLIPRCTESGNEFAHTHLIKVPCV